MFTSCETSSISLQVRFISSKDQLADTFTKALPTRRLSFLRGSLNVHELPWQLQGTCQIIRSHQTIKKISTQEFKITPQHLPEFIIHTMKNKSISLKIEAYIIGRVIMIYCCRLFFSFLYPFRFDGNGVDGMLQTLKGCKKFTIHSYYKLPTSQDRPLFPRKRIQKSHMPSKLAFFHLNCISWKNPNVG